MTIDGKQIPPPPMKFGGVIKESATESKPWWPPRAVPPKGAPNVLLIMTDDQGYAVSSAFGGVIPVFVYNLLDLERFRWEGGVGGVVGEDLFARALEPGKHTLLFDFKYDGPGPGKGGTGVFTVDGKEMARKKLEHTIPLMMSIDETFDVGPDTRTAVDGSYEVPFAFTGTIDKLTFKLGPSQLSAAQKAEAGEATARARD